MGNHQETQSVPATGNPVAGKLFIGIPIYGGVDPHFFCSILQFNEEKHRLPFPVHCSTVIGDSLVSRARNTITMEFLKSDCTHLLMIDSDLVFSSDHVVRIMGHNLDVVGGFYPKKKDGDAELVFNSLQDVVMDERGLTEVNYIGTGFLCVSRKVIEAMISEYGDDIIFKVDGAENKVGFDFWPVGVYKYPDGSRRYLSEDWYFCQRARDLGFKVWGDNRVLLKHSGNALYPLKHQEQQIFGKAVGDTPAPTIPEMAASPRLSPVTT